MRLLVTGGAGFIGSNFIHHVIARPEIELLVNLDCLTYAGNIENLQSISGRSNYIFEKVDLRDKSEVLRVVRQHQITHVLHLAAESHVDRSIAAPDDFIQTNIVGTFNLLEACRESWLNQSSANPIIQQSNKPIPAFRFHHVSTDEVFGSLGITGYFDESSPYAPNSPYSASKAGSDFLVRACRKTYGLPTVISYSSNNYGPYQHSEKFIPTVILNALSQKPIPLYGDGSNIRDWIHVRDHAEALWRVLTAGRDGESYCISAGNEMSNLNIATLICNIVDSIVPNLGNSHRLITPVKDRPGHDFRYGMKFVKVQRELGWNPAMEFAFGIQETVKWYLANKAG